MSVGAKARQIRLGFVGDVCLGFGVRDAILQYGAHFPFAHLRPLLLSFDAVIGNLECCIVPSLSAQSGKVKPAMVERALAGGLRDSGITAVSLANNHILDCGPDGLASTREFLEGIDIPSFGAGNNLEVAETAYVLECGGRRVAFLGACDVSACHASSARAGVAPMWRASLSERIRAAARDADVVAVILHADLEFARAPSPARVRLSRRLVADGAHLVIQHHPHVLQGVEAHLGGIIAYSLGNCIFGIAGNPYQEPHREAWRSCVMEVRINFDSTVPRFEWTPIPISLGVDHATRPSGEEAATATLERIRVLSELLKDPALVASEWRHRCAQQMRHHVYQTYYEWRRGGFARGLAASVAPLLSEEDRRWVAGFLSAGHI